MSVRRMSRVRNIIFVIFFSYLILQIINYVFPSAFYLSLAINFSNRYMLFALAYLLISLNLEKHEKESHRFFLLVISIFILTLAPIGFLVYDIKEFDLNDPLSSLLYINVLLHLLSLYTIIYSIRMIRNINSLDATEKKFYYFPHSIYLVLMTFFVLNDFEITSIPPLYLDAVGLLGAIMLLKSISRFQHVVIE